MIRFKKVIKLRALQVKSDVFDYFRECKRKIIFRLKTFFYLIPQHMA